MAKKRLLITCILAGFCASVAFAAGRPDATAEATGFNATGYPIVDESVTLRVAAVRRPEHTKPFSEMLVLEKAEEITNVRIDWVGIPLVGFAERVNLMLAAGDLPDLFFPNVGDYNVASQAAQGTFIPLQDLIWQYAPNLQDILRKHPGLESQLTFPDGNIYSLFRMIAGGWMRLAPIFYMDKPLMKELGIEGVPQTLEQFYDVLVQARDTATSLGLSVTPLGFRFHSGSEDLSHLFYSHGLPIQRAENLYVVDGQVGFAAVTDRYRQTVKYLNRLWQAGVMESEGFALSGADYAARIIDGRYLVYTHWQVENIIAEERWDDYAVVGPLWTDDYDPKVNYNFADVRIGYNTITSHNRYPEVTMRWIDYWYDTRNSIELGEGPIGAPGSGARLVEKPDGTIGVAPPPPGFGIGDWRHLDTLGVGSPFAISRETFRDYFVFEAAERKTRIIDEYYAPYWPEEFWTRPLLDYAAITEVNRLRPDIAAYVERMLAEWITDGGIDADWDEYLRTLERMGLSRLLEIYQEGYDSMLTMLRDAGVSIRPH